MFQSLTTHRLVRRPHPNPSGHDPGLSSNVSQPEPLTYQRSPCQNKGNFFLLHCGCVFLHGLQVRCFFEFGLATYTVTVKANIKHLLTCLLIITVWSKTWVTTAAKQHFEVTKHHVLWPLVQKRLAASQPTTGNFYSPISTHVMSRCVFTDLYLWKRRRKVAGIFLEDFVSFRKSVLFTSALCLQAWSLEFSSAHFKARAWTNSLQSGHL